MAVTSKLRHVVESQQFSRSLLEELFARAEEIKREPHRFMGRLAGQVMAARALLDACPRPTIEQVKEWMTGNLCRCTGYYKIVESVLAAAARDGWSG